MMLRRTPLLATLLAAGLTATSLVASADVRPHAGMLRYPDVSATHIVFVYANDLWLVPRSGGLAAPLASPPGPETFPRFSPDGGTIAFVGNYDGNRDLYTIPAAGGPPTRITHHPAAETLTDFPAAGELVFASNGFAGLGRQQQLFRVSTAGGLPQQLPVPYGANGVLSADGQWLAYTPHSTDQRTWKRYRGGMATDIWLFHLTRNESKRITDWEGTDTLPLWHEQTVYYLSDAGDNHRLNIWAYDTAVGTRKQVTDFADFDVKFPSVGPGASGGGGEIVFQLGPQLMLLDVANGQSVPVNVLIPGDRPTIRPRAFDVSETLSSFDVSATGKRAVLEVRGDLWTLPAEKGSPRNLTRTSGIAERMPAWSPDGRWIAYLSDATGEYELYVMQSDGKGEARQLTKSDPATLPAAFRYNPTWSPDSKHVALTDKAGAIFVHTLDGDRTRRIDTEPWAQQPGLSWSHDSGWLAYTKGGRNQRQAVWLYDLRAEQAHQVTAGMFNDSWPTFDREGKYLFLASGREITSPIYDHTGDTFVYVETDVLLAVPLRKDIASPFAPKSDEESWDGTDKDDATSKPASSSASAPASQPTSDEAKDKKKPIEPLKIDLDGFEQRAVKLPVGRANFYALQVNEKGHLLYIRGAKPGSGGEPSLKLFDLTNEKREEKTVIDGLRSVAITADGKKLLVRQGDKLGVIDAAADQKLEKLISREGLSATIDPREEWKQIFTEAWRVQRDFFYDPHMHGVDWPALRKQYEQMLADCVSREDVTYVIGELISELNVGHAYVSGTGSSDRQPEVSVGMLGCDFALENGAYRIAKIHAGAAWDIDARGPLSQPGIDAKEGDYLLAVNGVALDASKSPWAAFQGLAGKTVTLTVNASPPQPGLASQPNSREVIVELLGSESNLRYRDWIERKRAYVAEKTGGRVGYIYVPNTGQDGQTDLFRQFHGQLDREALIIDERWNGGGQIPTRFIELLNRPVYNYWAKRDGFDWYSPGETIPGPKCMLINGLAGSGGDAFPHYFRKAGLGKLLGTRTWGGLVGISGNPGFIDGGSTTAPTFAFYDPDGTWGIEGHGVDPDIEVIDDPAKMLDGGDPQLDAAIALMLDELKNHPYVTPQRPPYPDRKGMGILEQDK